MERGNRRLWLETAIIFAAWAVFGLLRANQSYMQSVLLEGFRMPWIRVLRPALLEACLWAFITLAIFWLARRVPFERGRILRGLAVHVAAAVVIALARTGVMVALASQVRWIRVAPFGPEFFGTSSQTFLVYALLLGIAHMVIYYRRYREREQAAEQLARGLAEARLRALKMQLQPHFLFNTLNAISALIPADAKPARRMLAHLGDLLRTTLEYEEAQEVTLREELAFLQPYLDIEQARLEERLTVVIDIAPDTLDARVPHLLLQPLVENAVRHGIAARIEPGRVEISAARGPDARFLLLEITNDGRDGDRRTDIETRTGVGLPNIRSRLQHLYGAEHRFNFENQPGGRVRVQITLPFRRADTAERVAP